jgi:hypothetical protein
MNVHTYGFSIDFGLQGWRPKEIDFAKYTYCAEQQDQQQSVRGIRPNILPSGHLRANDAVAKFDRQ